MNQDEELHILEMQFAQFAKLMEADPTVYNLRMLRQFKARILHIHKIRGTLPPLHMQKTVYPKHKKTKEKVIITKELNELRELERRRPYYEEAMYRNPTKANKAMLAQLNRRVAQLRGLKRWGPIVDVNADVFGGKRHD